MGYELLSFELTQNSQNPIIKIQNEAEVLLQPRSRTKEPNDAGISFRLYVFT